MPLGVHCELQFDACQAAHKMQYIFRICINRAFADLYKSRLCELQHEQDSAKLAASDSEDWAALLKTVDAGQIILTRLSDDLGTADSAIRYANLSFDKTSHMSHFTHYKRRRHMYLVFTHGSPDSAELLNGTCIQCSIEGLMECDVMTFMRHL